MKHKKLFLLLPIFSLLCGCNLSLFGEYEEEEDNNTPQTVVPETTPQDPPFYPPTSYAYEQDGFYYADEPYSGGYTLIAVNSKEEEVTIRETVNYKPVVNIADFAYSGNKYLKKLVIECAGEVGANAFDGCTNLTEVFLKNESLNTIGQFCFTGCSSLEKFTCSPNLETISVDALSYCGHIKEAHFTGNLRMIGQIVGTTFGEVSFGGGPERWATLTNGKEAFTNATVTCYGTDDVIDITNNSEYFRLLNNGQKVTMTGYIAGYGNTLLYRQETCRANLTFVVAEGSSSSYAIGVYPKVTADRDRNYSDVGRKVHISGLKRYYHGTLEIAEATITFDQDDTSIHPVSPREIDWPSVDSNSIQSCLYYFTSLTGTISNIYGSRIDFVENSNYYAWGQIYRYDISTGTRTIFKVGDRVTLYGCMVRYNATYELYFDSSTAVIHS